MHGGNVAEGIEAYAQQQDWEKCLELAQQQGPHMLVKYASLHGAALIQRDADFLGAAKVRIALARLVAPHCMNASPARAPRGERQRASTW